MRNHSNPNILLFAVGVPDFDDETNTERLHRSREMLQRSGIRHQEVCLVREDGTILPGFFCILPGNVYDQHYDPQLRIVQAILRDQLGQPSYMHVYPSREAKIVFFSGQEEYLGTANRIFHRPEFGTAYAIWPDGSYVVMSDGSATLIGGVGPSLGPDMLAKFSEDSYAKAKD